MKQFSIGRFLPQRAQQIKDRLHGQTYLNIEILICPAGGEFEVIAQTLHPACSQEEFVGMLVYVMACEL